MVRWKPPSIPHDPLPFKLIYSNIVQILKKVVYAIVVYYFVR